MRLIEQMNLARLMSASCIGAEDLMAQLNREQMSAGQDADAFDLFHVLNPLPLLAV